MQRGGGRRSSAQDSPYSHCQSCSRNDVCSDIRDQNIHHLVREEVSVSSGLCLISCVSALFHRENLPLVATGLRRRRATWIRSGPRLSLDPSLVEHSLVQPNPSSAETCEQEFNVCP